MRAPQRLRAPRAVDTIVVGAGHSGLAMSHVLTEHGVEHVVLERGEVASARRHERWDSLRLLTPNWQSRLPGHRYAGRDPDGYMTSAEIADFIADYASRIGAPGVPVVPGLAAQVPRSVRMLTAKAYRNPAGLDPGPVLVVGASATGLQLADEIRRSGRRVMLAVGEHIRMPRVYRGRDIQWWLDAVGILDERYDEVDDIVRARRVPSPQLVGSPERRALDLNALAEQGVEIVGRLAGIDGTRLLFSGSLANHCSMADLKLDRLLDRIDAWVAERGMDGVVAPPERFERTRVEAKPRLTLDLAKERVATIVWATGFRPDYPWLELPVLDAKGRLRHDGGIVGNGIYALGLNFMRRRKSSYIHGAEDDVRELGANLVQHLHGAVHRPVTSNRHLAPSLGRFALASLNAVVSRPMRYRT